jgi:hypothetical protein
VQVPFLQSVFDTEGLTVYQWLVCIAVSSTILILEEIRKGVVRIAWPLRGSEAELAAVHS